MTYDLKLSLCPHKNNSEWEHIAVSSGGVPIMSIMHFLTCFTFPDNDTHEPRIRDIADPKITVILSPASKVRVSFVSSIYEKDKDISLPEELDLDVFICENKKVVEFYHHGASMLRIFRNGAIYHLSKKGEQFFRKIEKEGFATELFKEMAERRREVEKQNKGIS